MNVDRKLRWIPWKRYVLMLCIDGEKVIELGRFRRRETPDRMVKDLSIYKGYEPRVVDSKGKESKC